MTMQVAKTMQVANQKYIILILLTALIVFSAGNIAHARAVNDRSPQVRDAIVAAVPGINLSSDVTEAHLAAITSLNLRSASISELKTGDFEGLTGLTNLNLYNNQLSSLPVGIFTGLSALTTLRLGNNAVDPLPITVLLEKVGVAKFKAVAPTGAPFDIVLPVSAINGSISGRVTTMTIPIGSVESNTVTVTRTPGTILAVTADIGTLPRPPQNHYGYALVKSDASPLEVITGINTAPVFTDGANTTRTVAENTPAAVNIGTAIAATDTNNDTLTYSLGGTDAASFNIDSTTGQLKTQAPLNHETKSSYTVTLTVSDGSFTDTITVTISVTDVTENHAPVFIKGDSTIRTVLENTPAAVNIGTPVSATDADGALLAYTLGGIDADAFDLDSDGQLRTKAPLDYETKHVYTVTITVDDESLTDTITVIISVIDTNDTVITPVLIPVSERTPQVRDAIVAAAGVSSASDVTTAHLATITSLNLRATGISELQTSDFSGLSGLTNLNLYGNQLFSLPVGVFDGLTALTTLRLGGNAVEPLSLIVSLQQVGDGAFKAVIPTGAPFNIVLLVSVTNGSISGGLTSVTIPQGSVESATFTVISTSGTSTIPTVSIGALPRVPPNHFGYILAQSRVCNRTPQVASAIAAAVPSASGCGDVTEVDLATITTLNLNGMSIHSLKTDDFAGMLSLTTLYLGNNQLTSLPDGLFDDLISLQALYLSGNELTSLPDSIFDGLISLRTLSLSNNELTSLPDSIFDGLVSLQALYLSGNRVAPLPLTVSLEQVGEKQFNARAPAGAPFDIVLPLNVTNGSINGGAMTLTIPAGSVESQLLTVTRTAGTTAAATVDIGTLPNPPSLHEGYTLVKTNKFPLEVISRINSPPMFTEGDSTTRTVAENTPAAVNIGTAAAATDADDDTLTYSLGGTDAAAFSIDSSSGQLKTRAALDYETQFSYSVTVSVFDGNGGSGSITVIISVTDINENHAPILVSEISSVTLTVGGGSKVVDVSSNFSDPDGDTLNYTLIMEHPYDPSIAVVAVHNTPGIFSIEPRGIGSTTVTVTASDGEFTATQTISITVTENQTPVLVSELPSRIFLEIDGESEVVDVSGNFSDPNGDSLIYAAQSSNTNVATVSVDGSQVKITPRRSGTDQIQAIAQITVTASDGQSSVSDTIEVWVTAPPAEDETAPPAENEVEEPAENEAPTVTAPKPGNRAPVAVGTIAVTLTAGGRSEVVDVSSNFSDPDGDTLNYTLIMEYPYDPSIAVVAVHNTPGIFSIEPRGIGSTTVTVTVSDGEFTATQTISITVTENQTPVLVSELPSRIFLEIDGESEVVDVSGNFSDPNGDSLIYAAQSSNTNVATVSVDGSQVRITPRRSGTDQIQAIAQITVTASDGQSSVSDTIEVWVTAPPAEDETAPPAENEVEEPAENEAPTVTAPKPGNRAPVAVGTIAVTLTAGGRSEVVDVSSNFSDPDGDTLNYTLIMEYPYDPSIAVVAVHNTPGIFSIEPRGIGSTTVTVTASDGEFTATQTISITVTENQTPVLVSELPSRIFLEIDGESEVVDVSGNFSDPNGDSLIYAAQSSNTNVATVSVDGSQVRITPRRSGTDQIQAIAQIIVTASDGQSSVSDTIEVWVTAPLSTELLPNYPNPFNPETWIPYHLAKDSDIEITIYDTLGTVIRRLELGHQSAGYYTSRSRAAYWNGRNTLGEQVPSGVYFYHLQADNVSLLRKMVILK